ncbi:MAG: nuclear transport factor 2 family protein [Acidimicrobiales bacterium]
MTTTETTTVIDRFLEGVRAGRVGPELYAEEARLDATVPGWRFQAHGPTQIAAEYRSWFAGPSVLETVERHPIDGGEVVRYFHTFEVGGQPYAAHHVHLLTVHDDRVVADTVFCGGRWGPEVLAQLGAAAHAG